MSAKKSTYIAIGVTIAVVGLAWYFYSHTKRYYATRITKLGGASNFATLLTFEEGYLKQWAKGLSKGKETFLYQGKSYNTQGGKIVT